MFYQLHRPLRCRVVWILPFSELSNFLGGHNDLQQVVVNAEETKFIDER